MGVSVVCSVKGVFNDRRKQTRAGPASGQILSPDTRISREAGMLTSAKSVLVCLEYISKIQGCRSTTFRYPRRRMYFALPDLKRIYPFPSSLNPYLRSIAFDSKAWIDSFEILSGYRQRQFSTSTLEFLAARMRPYADREGYRTTCDYANLIFILDDYNDDEGRKTTRVMSDSSMNSLEDPSWDDGTDFARSV